MGIFEQSSGSASSGPVAAGSGTGTYYMGGILATCTTAAGNLADAVEKTLFTYTLPGGTLDVNGRGLEFLFWGNFAANANPKSLRVYFGATQVNAVTVAANNQVWRSEVTVLRDSATVQRAIGLLTRAATMVAPDITTPGETLANDIIIKVTGQDNGGVPVADSVTITGGFVRYLP